MKKVRLLKRSIYPILSLAQAHAMILAFSLPSSESMSTETKLACIEHAESMLGRSGMTKLVMGVPLYYGIAQSDRREALLANPLLKTLEEKFDSVSSDDTTRIVYLCAVMSCLPGLTESGVETDNISVNSPATR